MHKPTRQSIDTSAILQSLAQPAMLPAVGPIAGRFIDSLRLIALHDRAKRDAVPELTVRLGGVDIAAKTLALSQAISATWPENILVSRFCCQRLTHDEATIAAMIDGVCARDRAQFDHQVEGLIRPARADRLWDTALDLVAAECR
ncbi:MAG: DNA-directed RNA polymerase subunit beta' [Erythrobacter sp.]